MYKRQLPQFGVETTFVDAHNLEELEGAIKDNTKAVYIETLGNPNSDIPEDVYKRQVTPSTVTAVIDGLTIRLTGFATEPITVSAPVSYTHLDVYKRQQPY